MNRFYPRIALVSRRRSPESLSSVLHLAQHLRAQGFAIYLDAEAITAHVATDFPRVERSEIGHTVDLVIVIGGDGTLLGIARLLAGFEVPLVGINHGRLGFMTDIALADAVPALAQILQGEHIAEHRILLDAKIFRAGEEIAVHNALNDIVFGRGAFGAMIEFEIFIDQQFVYSQRSDGLIVSTPTGSTAYALAAGGPILHPNVPAITLVPICPQSMTNRPIAVGDQCEVEFVLLRGAEARIHFDGQSHVDLQEADRIQIRRSNRALTLLHPKNYDYYAILRQKLHWGEQLL